MISEKIKKDSSFLSGLEPWNLDGGGVVFLIASLLLFLNYIFCRTHICEYLCETVNYYTDIFVTSNFSAYFSATVIWWAMEFLSGRLC